MTNSTFKNLDPEEIKRFSAIADQWWEPNGNFAPLHRINPLRLEFIRDQVAAHFNRDIRQRSLLADLKLVDIGCGGGLLCEPLSRMGAKVTGLDPAEESIKSAQAHAISGGLKIDYRAIQAEEVAANGEQFDIVINMEVIEHVPDVADFVQTSAKLLKPGGLMLLSTLNRTAKSYAMAIVGAEYVLNWVPRGTHHWDRFVTPQELQDAIESANMSTGEFRGMVYNPLLDIWKLSADDLDVNYLVSAVHNP